MRIILLSLLFLATNGYAQYRCIPHTQLPGNPSGVENDDYATSGNGYYHAGILYDLSPVWGNSINIGFPFLFNGLPVTHFKVSTTGVLTFDTLVVNPAPPHSNGMLPDISLPENSVCIRGISALYYQTPSSQSTGMYSTFNTPQGNKQMWVTFRYFSDTIVSTNTRTTQWSIVLESGTNNIYIVNQFNLAFTGSVVPGIQINDTTAYMAPGSPLPALAGNSSIDVDNIYYEFRPGVDLSYDGSIVKAVNHEYLDLNDAPFSLAVEWRNLGTDTITSLDLQYSLNGSAPVTETFTSLIIPTGDRVQLQVANPWSPVAGSYNIEFSGTNLNGFADEDTTNDKLNKYIYVGQSFPKRRVTFEEFKGLWCLWCGYWTVRLDSVMKVNEQRVSIVKYDDFLHVPWGQNDYSKRRNFYNVTGYPSAFGNGFILDQDPTLYTGCPWNATTALIDSLYELPGLFDIESQLTFNGFDGVISGSITSLANINPSGKLRLMVSLVADTVRFASPQGTSGEDHFYNTNYKLFPDGDGTFIGAPVLGQVDSFSFSITITDTMVNVNEMHAVIFIQDSITGEIFQSEVAIGVQLCQPVTNVSFYHICSYDSINFYGNWYSQGGNYPTIYTGSNGCDSLQMNILKVANLFSSIVFYNGALQWSGLSYTYPIDSIGFSWYNHITGIAYPAQINNLGYPLPFTPPGPGFYSLLMENSMNCFDTSAAVFAPGINSYLNYQLICNGDSINAGSSWYTQPGYYLDSLQGFSGIDSIVFTSLSLITLNTALTLVNDTIYAFAGYTSYVWMDCNTNQVIPGANLNYLLSQAGSYQVIMTDSNGCSATSGCFTITGLENASFEVPNIYPNPTHDYLFISNPLEQLFEIAVFDLKGKHLLSTKSSDRQIMLNSETLSPGMYILQISNKNNKKFVKFIKT